MKLETRIELAVIIIVALVLGGWVGFKLISKTQNENPNPQPGESATELINDPTTQPPNEQEPEEDTTPIATTDTTTPPSFAEDIRKVQALFEDEKLFDARELLTRMILEMPEGKDRKAVKEMLAKINRSLFFSREKSPDCIIYKIQAGDSLSKIATRQSGKDFYFAKLIQQINGIRDAKRIRPGKTLKIPQGRFSALAQKRAHRLIVFLNGHYIKEYPIAIGAQVTPTPETTFAIDTKQVKPTWYAPDGNVYKYGHPKNVLGTRWLGFKEKGEYQSYGIHGTADPESIGKNVSNGCIRLHNKDAEELFTMLMKGDTVKIIK